MYQKTCLIIIFCTTNIKAKNKCNGLVHSFLATMSAQVIWIYFIILIDLQHSYDIFYITKNILSISPTSSRRASACFFVSQYYHKIVTTKQFVIDLHTWNSAVVKMWRPSALHLTSTRPAEPSSILHVHSGSSKDQTYNSYLNKHIYAINSWCTDILVHRWTVTCWQMRIKLFIANSRCKGKEHHCKGMHIWCWSTYAVTFIHADKWTHLITENRWNQTGQ